MIDFTFLKPDTLTLLLIIVISMILIIKPKKKKNFISILVILTLLEFLNSYILINGTRVLLFLCKVTYIFSLFFMINLILLGLYLCMTNLSLENILLIVITIENQFDTIIKSILKNNGLEFLMHDFFYDKGIIHQTTYV